MRPNSSPERMPASSSGFRSWPHHFLKGTGLLTVFQSSADVKLILAQRFVRVFAFGLVALLLAAYLAALGHSETQIGVFFGLTLLGDLVIVMVLTQIADAVGRKTVLIVGAVSMTASGIVFALTDNYWILLCAAVVSTAQGIFPRSRSFCFFLRTRILASFRIIARWHGYGL